MTKYNCIFPSKVSARQRHLQTKYRCLGHQFYLWIIYRVSNHFEFYVTKEHPVVENLKRTRSLEPQEVCSALAWTFNHRRGGHESSVKQFELFICDCETTVRGFKKNWISDNAGATDLKLEMQLIQSSMGKISFELKCWLLITEIGFKAGIGWVNHTSWLSRNLGP